MPLSFSEPSHVSPDTMKDLQQLVERLRIVDADYEADVEARRRRGEFLLIQGGAQDRS